MKCTFYENAHFSCDEFAHRNSDAPRVSRACDVSDMINNKQFTPNNTAPSPLPSVSLEYHVQETQSLKDSFPRTISFFFSFFSFSFQSRVSCIRNPVFERLLSAYNLFFLFFFLFFLSVSSLMCKKPSLRNRPRME